METAIEVNNLKKSFPGIEAVNDVSFNVKKGEIFGLIGPVGAGKTTILRILSGIMMPFLGNVKVLGLELPKYAEEIKHDIGYMAQGFSLYDDLTVQENIYFFSRIHLIDKAALLFRLPPLLEMTRLGPFTKRLARNLSGGMKQKLALICALVHRPRLLILDEPTTGVDPVSRREFWNILRDIVSEGVTILLSTPYMDEAEWCGRIGLLSHGNLFSCDSPNNLKKEFNAIVIEVTPATDYDIFIKVFKTIEGIKDIQVFGKKYHIILRDETHLNEIRSKLENIAQLRRMLPSKKNIFINKIKQ